MLRVNERAHLAHLEGEAFARNLNLMEVSAECGDDSYTLKFSICRGPVFNVLICKSVYEIQAGEVNILDLISAELDVGMAQIDSLSGSDGYTVLGLSVEEGVAKLQDMRVAANDRATKSLKAYAEVNRAVDALADHVFAKHEYVLADYIGDPVGILGRITEEWDAASSEALRLSDYIVDLERKHRLECDVYKGKLALVDKKLRTWERIAERDHGKPPGSFRKVVKELEEEEGPCEGDEGVEIIVRCWAEGCRNEGRYDSHYCGIHDILLNGGRGKLRRGGK